MPPRAIALSDEKAKALGEVVRRLREPRTQRDLAEGHNFGPDWLSRLESGGAGSVAVNKLSSLSMALGLPKDALERFLEGVPLPEGGATVRPRVGHGGTLGWPPILEAGFRALQEAVAEEQEARLAIQRQIEERDGLLEELTEKVGGLTSLVERLLGEQAEGTR